MSIRHYKPRARNRRAFSGARAIILPSLLVLTILLEVSYPLTHGNSLRVLTLATVALGAFMMVLHAYFAFGARFMKLVGLERGGKR